MFWSKYRKTISVEAVRAQFYSLLGRLYDLLPGSGLGTAGRRRNTAIVARQLWVVTI